MARFERLNNTRNQIDTKTFWIENFNLLISNSFSSTDHLREAGDVCYADVYKDGTGIVEFLRYEDMKYAVKKLDDSRFRSHEGEGESV